MKIFNQKWFPILAVFLIWMIITIIGSFILPYDFSIAASRELGVQGIVTFLFSKHWLAGGLASYFMNYGGIMSSTTNDAITGSAFVTSSAACLACAVLNYLGARFMLAHYDDELSCSITIAKRSLLAVAMFSLLMTSSYFVIEAYKTPNLEINTLTGKFIIILFVSVEIRFYLLVYRYFKKRREVITDAEKA